MIMAMAARARIVAMAVPVIVRVAVIVGQLWSFISGRRIWIDRGRRRERLAIRISLLALTPGRRGQEPNDRQGGESHQTSGALCDPFLKHRKLRVLLGSGA
jgi:hypothetical protein